MQPFSAFYTLSLVIFSWYLEILFPTFTTKATVVNTCCQHFSEVFFIYPPTLVCLSLIYFSFCSSRNLTHVCWYVLVLLEWLHSALIPCWVEQGSKGPDWFWWSVYVNSIDGYKGGCFWSYIPSSSGSVLTWRHWNICMEDRESKIKFW